MRLDDIVRSERYFTATLLPLILFQRCGKDWNGLHRFVALLREKYLTEKCPDGFQRNGQRIPFPEALPSFDAVGGLDPQIITEFHIKRDLLFSRPTLFQQADLADEEDRERRDAPDLVVIVNQRAIVCEGKFFTTGNAQQLNPQLASQRLQLEHLFLADESLKSYVQVALVPGSAKKANKGDYDCCVLTWEEIRDLSLSKPVMKDCNYVAERLTVALELLEAQKGIRWCRITTRSLTLTV